MGIIHSFLLGTKTADNKQQTETQEQFSKLRLSNPAKDTRHQPSNKDPLLVKKLFSSTHTFPEISKKSDADDDDRDGTVGSAKQECCPKEDYSNKVDRLATALLRGFEHSLAGTSVREEILDHHQARILPSLVRTHERVPENGSIIVGRGEKRRKRKRKKKSVKTVTVVDEAAKWINHYSSSHKILLVGEGDFSFSACLAVAFGMTASNMIATSLNSKKFLKKNYKTAMSNIEILTSRRCKLMHGINATKMANHTLLQRLKFDRIVFNFPFAGFFKDRQRDSQLRLHRRLVSKFLQNAKEMICKDGEIHISHKTNGFHSDWDLVCIASSHGLRLIEAVEFKLHDYPGYNTKRGFGGDENFNCNPSKTFKFGLKIMG